MRLRLLPAPPFRFSPAGGHPKHPFATLLFSLVLTATLASALPGTHSDGSAQGPPRYKGRIIAPVMSAAGADWLNRPEREQTEMPDRLLDALQIEPGMTVADVGAGIGYFSWRIAGRVGAEGRVLAVEIQPAMLERLEAEMRKRDIRNVRSILGTPVDPNLPARSVDLALMVDVYHEFRHPEAMISRIRQSLKDDGRMVLVEYRGEDPAVPIRPEHKMTVQQVLLEILPMGFRLQSRLDFLPWQHVFIFVKDSGNRPAPSN
ncbi:MAG: methyltransferase domain-containing protein [Acidobacteriota bacterium]|nr:methyltransferase domain-containing protein [Acidobacteriota bacterium]MDE2964929.1 methyltransferase domain-containing protein [Acidobacteriota bacterium]